MIRLSHSGLLLLVFLSLLIPFSFTGFREGRDIKEMISEYKELLREYRAKGRDASEAVELAERAKRA